MTLTELCAEIYSLTSRPDLVNETKMAVRSATLKAHQLDFFYKDIEETGVSFSSADYLQTLDYKSLFPLYRSLKYIRKAEADGTPGDFLSVITPTSVLDRYGTAREDICYTAGAVIQIKSSTALQYILFGFYSNPDITEAGYNSWIATDHPFALIYEAASVIFKTIGQDEKATLYNKLAGELLQAIKVSNIEAEGV